MEEVDIELVNQELNFEPHGSNLVVKGGCDLFSIKKVKDDHRLFKTIEAHLDQIIEDNELLKSVDHDRTNLFSLYGLSAGLVATVGQRRNSHIPPGAGGGERSRHNLMLHQPATAHRGLFGDGDDELPFGPLREIHTRKTFAYLIGILNTTFPDHDFSNLQPTTENFHRILTEELMTKFNNVLLLLGKRQDQLSWIWDTINVYMDIIALNQGLPFLAPQSLPAGLRKNSFAGHEGRHGLVSNGAGFPQGADHIQVYLFQPLDDLILEDLMYPHRTMWQNYWLIYNRKMKRVLFLYLVALNKMHYTQLALALHQNLADAGLVLEEDAPMTDGDDIIGDMEM